MRKVNAMPCKFPEMSELNLLEKRIKEWEVSVQEVLALSSRSVKRDEGKIDLPDLKKVEELVSFGRSIEVDLKPLLPLRYVSSLTLEGFKYQI